MAGSKSSGKPAISEVKAAMLALCCALDQLRLAVSGQQDDGDGPRLGDPLGSLDTIGDRHANSGG